MEVKVHEVGLRDGLQMEREKIPSTDKKIDWIKRLMSTGIDIIQVGSFVHPKRVPQMADTDEIFKHFLKNGKQGKAILSGLVLNEKGLERGLDCGVEMFCMGVSASNTHSQKNTGMTLEEAATRIINMAKTAINKGLMVQASVQSAFGCGFEGKIDENVVIDIIKKYLDAGINMISLADTAGHAHPEQVEKLFGTIKKIDENIELTAHFHNTYGLGLANCYAAMKQGVKFIETAFGGIGGCPFTKVAAGNVSTEDFVHSINRQGIRQDIDIDELIKIAEELSEFLGRSLPGYVYKTGKLNY